MFALNDNDTTELTVYNDGDGTYHGDDGDDKTKSSQEFISRTTPCCSDGNADDCEFVKGCSKDFKVFQRRLLLGEPVEDGTGINDDELEKALMFSVMLIANEFKNEGEVYLEENHEENWLRVVSLLRAFVQLNFTGPENFTAKSVQDQLQALTLLCEGPFVEQLIQTELELEGIELEPNTRLPILIVVVKHLLLKMEKSSRFSWPFYLHWRFRVDFLHQKMLERRSISLSQRLRSYASAYLAWRKKNHHKNEGVNEVDASFMIEIAEMLTYYYDGLLAPRFLEEAKKVLGVQVEFSGKMGFRTKFQQTAMAQTTVNVSVTGEQSIKKSLFHNLENLLPKSLTLDDDTRLERVRLEEDNENGAPEHGGIHQLVVLGMMNHKVAFEKHSELTRQEVQALVNTVLDNPVSWNGRVSALVARCLLEKSDRRAVDRSLRQLEDLVKTIWQNDDTNESELRHYLFFGSGLPSRPELKLVFAEVLTFIDHWKEALRIYEEIGHWEKIIRCYKMLQLRHKAEALLRSKIETEGESPKLLVLLGDATSDLSYYEKAWTLSGQKSYDSRIRLGEYYFSRQEWELAKPYLKEAIALSPLDYPCCLKLAWACYKTEDYSPAFSAYLKAANLEYDNFLVWSNLATCAIKLGRKEFALRAYKLAVKCNYDEWKIWCNLLIVATELGELNEGIQAYHRILELNKDWGDNEVLRELVAKVVEEGESGGLKTKMAELMGRITAQNARGPWPWLLYGRLLASYLDDEKMELKAKISGFERSLSYYSKALVLMRQNPRWKTEVGMMTNVVACVVEFRHQRCRQLPEGQESTSGITAFDSTLRETAKAVFKTVSDLAAANPSDGDLKELVDEMREELNEPFYAL